MILEINLHHRVRQTENQSVGSLPPSLNVTNCSRFRGRSQLGLLRVFIGCRSEVFREYLKEVNFLLDVF